MGKNNDLTLVFVTIKNDYPNYLYDDDKLLSIFSDLAPGLQREKKILRSLISCGGLSVLKQCREENSPQEIIRQKVKTLLERMYDEDGIAQENAYDICASFGIAIGLRMPTSQQILLENRDIQGIVDNQSNNTNSATSQNPPKANNKPVHKTTSRMQNATKALLVVLLIVVVGVVVYTVYISRGSEEGQHATAQNSNFTQITGSNTSTSTAKAAATPKPTANATATPKKTATPKPTVKATATPKTFTIYTTSEAVIRSRPSTDNNVSQIYEDHVKVGKSFTAYEEVVSESGGKPWYRISYNGGYAYISTTRTSTSKPTVTSKPAPTATPKPTTRPTNKPTNVSSSTVTEYRYRDLYSGYSEWSSWSSWTSSRETISDSNLKQEESRFQYGWWAAQCTNCGQNNPYHGKESKCYNCNKVLKNNEGLWRSVFAYTDDASGTQSIFGRSGGRYINGAPYWRSSGENDRTQYRYRTRTIINDWGSWSSWSTSRPESKSNRQIEERTVTK